MVKCNKCKRNIKELPYKCHRCSRLYCGNHRLPEEHNCSGLKNENMFNKLKRHKHYTSKDYHKPKLTPFGKFKRSLRRGYYKTLHWLSKRNHRKYNYSWGFQRLLKNLILSVIALVMIYFTFLYFPDLNMLLIWFIPTGWLLLAIAGFFLIKFGWEIILEIPNWFKRQRNWIKITIIILILIGGYQLYQERENLSFNFFDKEQLKGLAEDIGGFISEAGSDIGIGARDIEKIEYTVFLGINDMRKETGLSPLNLDPKLAEIAREHSQDMLTRGFYDHVNPDGEDPTDRARKKGIRTTSGGWIGIAENIAVVYIGNDADCSSYDEDVLGDCLIRKWMSSSGHRENILTSHYRDSGIGVACGNSECYATQTFR